jgi:hypothetical protein
MTCPYLCDADGTSCTILDGTSNSPSKRATTGQCMHYPAMYYNCEWFPNKDIPNLDTATQNTMPFYRASGKISIDRSFAVVMLTVGIRNLHKYPELLGKLRLSVVAYLHGCQFHASEI